MFSIPKLEAHVIKSVFTYIEYLVRLNLIPNTLVPMSTCKSKYHNLNTKALSMFDPDKDLIQEFIDHILGYTFAPISVRNTNSYNITVPNFLRRIATGCFDTFGVP